MEFFDKNQNSGQESKLWTKIVAWAKNWDLDEIETLAKTIVLVTITTSFMEIDILTEIGTSDYENNDFGWKLWVWAKNHNYGWES